MHDAARPTRELELYAIVAPGLERTCLEELTQLGVSAAIEDGGVAWRGDMDELYRANLQCRTASRIVARLGTFRARTFAELERHAAKLAWRDFVRESGAVALRVTARKSRLYHSGAIAERIAAVLSNVLGSRSTAVTEDEAGHDAQLVIVRFIRDVCTVSIDASGALLHQRGYRQAVAKAPLRETVAAAMLRAAGWQSDSPLLDPLCGSGTIAIEAALMARRIAPGIASPGLQPRRFAFQDWPGYDDARWRAAVAAARADVRPAAAAPIISADGHGGAIAAARANAARAGVDADIEFVRRDLAAWPARVPGAAGHIVTNPPWGVRVGERRRLFSLYAALGRLAASTGWRLAFLSADAGLDAAVGRPLRELLATRNGGIAVRLLAAEPASAAHASPDRTPGAHSDSSRVPDGGTHGTGGT